MSEPMHRRRPVPGRHRQWTRVLRERAALIGGGFAVVALCAAGVGLGAYAAIGEGARPTTVDGTTGIAAPPSPTSGEGEGAGAEDGSLETTPLPEASGPPASAQPSPKPSPGPTPPPTQGKPQQPSPNPDPTDPRSAKYNPYVTPGDPAFVTDDAKRAWLGRQAVIRECMAAAGFSYLEWQWWFGGSPMPPNLDTDAQNSWMSALRGEALADPEVGWDRAGCEGQAQHAADEAEAAGTPLTAELLPMPDGPTPRERWLEFQDAVRTCMADAGHEYRYWEFWNPEYAGDGGPAAMPPGLDDAARAAWNTAAFGSPDGGDGSLDTGGCWTIGADRTAYSEWS
ncbi:hypothetical protein GE115_04595 [Agromyces sp. CFH 90414]|uniref:Uncharacterized protein n=1 Tax=Agromyces agglutinans TaxID=2662258 RepID=A0A6I2F3K4_9MICO|nr:hypothetical protein [Agromyces agglutinans]MRG59149.1 hypothetical protein [Agromyces agglutinans]